MKTCDQCSLPIEDGDEFKDGPLVICYYCHVREFGEERPRRTKRMKRLDLYDNEEEY